MLFGTYVASHEALAGIGEAVHDVAEEGEELQQQGVDGQYLVADVARGRSDEGEHPREAQCAQEDVAVHLEEASHLVPVQCLLEK